MCGYKSKFFFCVVILQTSHTFSSSEDKDISFSALCARIHELEQEKNERNEQLKDYNDNIPVGDVSAARAKIHQLEQENIELKELLKDYKDVPVDEVLNELRAKIQDLEQKNFQLKEQIIDYKDDIQHSGE